MSPPPTHSAPANYLATLGLGYSIAIALGFLVLLSTLLLASYICCRSARPLPPAPSSPSPSPSPAVILPRIIFVAEDEDEDDGASNLSLGLHQSVINSYPRFPFTRGVSDSTCSICLCDYREAEMLRMMPECRHCFHVTCLDAWLKLNGSCPVCRNSPLPTPISTPLSEVVPLSQYSADRRRTAR